MSRGVSRGVSRADARVMQEPSDRSDRAQLRGILLLLVAILLLFAVIAAGVFIAITYATTPERHITYDLVGALRPVTHDSRTAPLFAFPLDESLRGALTLTVFLVAGIVALALHVVGLIKIASRIASHRVASHHG